MRIIILTVNQIYANKLLKDLILEFKKEIKLIIESAVILDKKSKLQSLQIYFNKSGFYYTFTQVVKLLLFKIASTIHTTLGKNWYHKLYSHKALAKKFDIKHEQISNINSEQSLKFLKDEKPDLIVSVYFNQILTGKVIKIPTYGVINAHPAPLPYFRGVSPVFWALSKGEKTTGISIHRIDGGIDSGPVIARAKIKIDENDTEDSLYFKATKIGSPLLVRAIKNIKTQKPAKVEKSKGSYFSIPTKHAVAIFKKRGRSFFKLYDYLFKN